jgi:hypothetical protein
MFSAILGLAGAGFGAYASMQAANSAAEAAMYQASLQDQAMRRQQDMQMFQMGMGQDQMRQMMEENNYRRQVEQNNRSQMAKERQFQIGEYNKSSEQIKAERDYMLTRQIQADQEAAKQRQFQLEEYLQSKTLAASERQQALAMLAEAKAIAKGERDDDLKRYYQNQQQRLEERDFSMRQYQTMQDRLVGERQYDIGNRNKIEGRLDDLYSTLQRTRAGLGDMPTVRQFSEQDFANEEARRRDLGIKLVDRAADKVASINEANLIRSGIDSGSAGVNKRAEITAQISDLYERAQMQARDEAMKYITGVQDSLYQGYDKELARRSAMLGEVGGVESTGISQLMQLKDPRSAVDNSYLQMPSGVYDRNVVSAGGYQSPLAVNSAVINAPNLPYGMANTLQIPSSVNSGWANIGSSVSGPSQSQFVNPQGFFNTASEIGNSQLNIYNQNWSDAQNRAAAASAAAGSSIQNLISGIGGFYDQWQQSRTSPSQW